MKPDYERILISENEIAARIAELAAELDRDYADKDALFVCILKGSVFFFSDLLKEMKTMPVIDFMAASSYGNATVSSGTLNITKDLCVSVQGKHVVLIEDIVDSGFTLSRLKEHLLSRHPLSVRICTLLNKPDRRTVDVEVDYCGFDIPDEFVVGYGLDYAEKYRNEKDIYILSRSVYGG